MKHVDIGAIRDTNDLHKFSNSRRLSLLAVGPHTKHDEPGISITDGKDQEKVRSKPLPWNKMVVGIEKATSDPSWKEVP